MNKSFKVGVSILFLFVSFCTNAGNQKLPNPVKDTDYYDNGLPSHEKVELGRHLFFDKILSGNKNISCATCHHSLTDTGDGLSLSVGEGGKGLGVTRDTGSGSDAIHERVPRNAPPLFNVGAKYFIKMFHDGRVELDPNTPSGFKTPANNDLPLGLENILAAQAMFPVTSATEMAGQAGENTVADATAINDLAGANGVWAQLANRLKAIPEYVDMFSDAFGITQAEISYVHAANAIAAFEASIWRSDNSPFDRFLRGERKSMSVSQKLGMKLFYGKAKCSTCHSGAFQSDMEFHSIALPQIGPGKGDGDNGREDFGREKVTGNLMDRYRFRTPSLRNVTLTGPWGHDGAYDSLDSIVMHHLNPTQSLLDYDCDQEPVYPARDDLNAIDCEAHNNFSVISNIAASNEMPRNRLRKRQLSYIMDFLGALTDPNMLDLRHDVPMTVPSKLPIAD